MVYLYNRLLFFNKKNALCIHNMTWMNLKNIVLSIRSYSQQTIILFHITSVLYDGIYMKCPEKSNLWRKKVDLSQVLHGVRDVSTQHDQNGHRGDLLRVKEMFSNWFVMIVAHLYKIIEKSLKYRLLMGKFLDL